MGRADGGERCARFGLNDFIEKPFAAPDFLFSVVERAALKKRRLVLGKPLLLRNALLKAK